MTTQTSQSQTTRRFFRPSDFDREWAAREFDIAADARIAQCRTAKIRRSQGPSRDDERAAAAMFAEMETTRQEQLAEDRRIFDRQNENPWRSGGSFSREIVTTASAKEPAMQLIVLDAKDLPETDFCIMCGELDFVDLDGVCPECQGDHLAAMEGSTGNLTQRSFKGAL